MTWLKANWPWLRWALCATAIAVGVIGARCYAGGQVRTALEGARARVEDSVSVAYAAVYARTRDSARQRAAVAQKIADSAKVANQITQLVADSATARAKRAERQAAELQHEVDSLPPRLAEAFDSLRESNAGLIATVGALERENRILGYAMDSLSEANRRLLLATVDADSALARKDSALAAYRAIKTPSRGLLATIVRVGSYVGIGLAGVAVGHL